MSENELATRIIGSAIEVHKEMGPGMLESVYQKALAFELNEFQGLPIETEKPMKVEYKGNDLDQGFRVDILFADNVVVELKSVETVLPVHKKQLLTYLKVTDKKLGLLINFNEELLKNGITRIVNKL